MKKHKTDKEVLTIISIVLSFFILVGSVVIYFYANGWRLDPESRTVLQTGVLNIESNPFLSEVSVNGENKGRTPKSMSLPVGIYTVTVKKDGYIDWKKNVEVKEEKSTPVYAWLIKSQIDKTNVYQISDETYVNSWINDSYDHMFVLTSTQDSTTKEFTYKIWKYNINTTFWDLSSNPSVIFTMNSKTSQTLGLLLSPSGQYAVLSVKGEDSTKKYLLNTLQSTNFDNLSSLPIDSFSKYTMTWSNDNQYLMFESDQELISFNIQKNTKYLLFRKNSDQKYTWTTDEQGYFYNIEANPNFDSTSNSSVYAYVLIQTEMDGSNPKTLINDLYFQKNTEYINAYQTDTGDGKYDTFTNSPESTKTVGDINGITVNQDAQGVFVSTDQASYWYSMEDKKYILISPYPSTFIQFSPDNQKLTFKDTNGICVFTFKKEEGDHTVEIGTKIVSNMDSSSIDIRWLSNSTYLSFIENDTLYIVDKDGDNKTELLGTVSNYKFTGLTSSTDKVFTLTAIKDDAKNNIKGLMSIDTYQIH